MSDIRKRTGKKGTTYQVRYPNSAAKTGYAYKTFRTMKEARAFSETLGMRPNAPVDTSIRTVPQAIDRWLEICFKEGRDGRDPVTPYTHKIYSYRADIMKAYDWEKDLHELQTPDVVKFRSWLLRDYTRDQAKKVMSSFHSVVKEMALRGHIASNVASGVSVRSESRYDKPIELPTANDIAALLGAADRLANSSNRQTARTWERYRPILYLAADSGMRPQEYVALARGNITDGGVLVDRALERGEARISVTKTPAGRRFIDLTPDVFDMVRHYADHIAVDGKYDLAFPTKSGRWLTPDHWRKRGFYTACIEAGLVVEEIVDGKKVQKPKFKPYDLRHFFASMLIEQNLNLKRIQYLMGHEDVTTTLNVYGHLIDQKDRRDKSKFNLLGTISQNPCGNSVADGR